MTRDRKEDEVLAIIKDRIMRLPREERLVTYLFYWEGLSYKEIAKELGLTNELVLKLHFRSLEKLESDLINVRSQLNTTFNKGGNYE